VLGGEREPTLNEAALSLAPPTGRYVVVSRSCTMIYLSSKQFREIAAREHAATDETALNDAVLLYPNDSRICRHVADVERWNAEKKHTVEELTVDKITNTKLRNFRSSSYIATTGNFYIIFIRINTMQRCYTNYYKSKKKEIILMIENKKKKQQQES